MPLISLKVPATTDYTATTNVAFHVGGAFYTIPAFHNTGNANFTVTSGSASRTFNYVYDFATEKNI